MHVRVCLECDEEYRPDIAVCADCGAELVDRYLDERGRVVGADGLPVPEPAVAEEPVVELYPLFTGAHYDLKLLADTLASAGIPMRLEPAEGNPPRLKLSVAAPDAERAWELLSSFQDRAAEMGLTCLVGRIDGVTPDTGYAACPACQVALEPDVANCPECGLELRGELE